jgi:hypothetical protein
MARDGILTVAGYWVALLLRFDGDPPDLYRSRLLGILLPIVGVLLLAGSAAGVY